MYSYVATAVLVALLTLVAIVSPQVQQLRPVASWMQMEYEFPSETVRNQTIASGEYVPGAGVLIDMDVDYGGQQAQPRVFVTVPRFTGGVPITFGTLSNQTGAGGPLISAYPNYTWNANQGYNCDGLTSVFRVAIDDCRRLWVLDSGKIGNNNTQSCPPQLVVFNLDTDAVILRYRFPVSQYKIGSSLFITPIVDVLDTTPGTVTTCNNTRVYIADVTGFGLLVYDLAQNTSWRAQNKFLYPAPHAGTFRIAGDTFDLMDGVFTLSLTPPNLGQRRSMLMPEPKGRRNHRPHSKPNRRPSKYPPAPAQTMPVTPAPQIVRGERLVYFHALASNFEVALPLRLLNNATLWNASVESVRDSFQEIGYRGTQSTAEAMDTNGNQFFGLINPIGIGCWDSTQPYDRRTIRVVAQNEQTLQFSSGLKLKRNRAGSGELWVASNRYQRIAAGTISYNEVNFRIQTVAMDQLVDGQSRCMGRTLA